MPEAVVVGGGDFPSHEIPLSILHNTPNVVCCDGAADEYLAHGLTPWRIVGDGDSLSNEAKSMFANIIRINPDQETNDQTKAIEYLAQKGVKDIAIVAATGRREDHTLGNISMLLYLDSLGKKGIIIDDYSEMEMISSSPAFINDRYAFFSLLNITGCAKGISIQNAKYPLDDGEITCEYQYGISNEVLPGKSSTVSVQYGRLLLIKIHR